MSLSHLRVIGVSSGQSAIQAPEFLAIIVVLSFESSDAGFRMISGDDRVLANDQERPGELGNIDVPVCPNFQVATKIYQCRECR